MTSVNGYYIHECPRCKGELSTPNYSSYNVKISGPLLTWIQCAHCSHTFELSKNTLAGYLPPLPAMPLSHGGFDLVGDTFEEQVIDLHRQTEAYHASNGTNVDRPPMAVFVTSPDVD